MRCELAWLGLDVDGLTAVVLVDDRHVTHLGRLYGGMGAALTSSVIEAVSRRPVLWATTQFVGAACKGDRLEFRAEILAEGRRTTQVRVDAFAGGRLILHGIGAASIPEQRIADGTVPRMPAVPPPDACPSFHLGPASDHQPNFFNHVETRDPAVGGEPRQRWWMRLSDGPALTRPTMLGLAGDFVPAMVMRALGEWGAGTSIDNTVRTGQPASGKWLLVDGQPEQASGGFGHGSVRLWSEDGTLAGVASQTSALWHLPGALVLFAGSR
jgi:acyl-CoA thioesterase